MHIPSTLIANRNHSEFQATRMTYLHTPVGRAICNVSWLEPSLAADEIRREGLTEYTGHLATVRAWKGQFALAAVKAQTRLEQLRKEHAEINQTLDQYTTSPPHYRAPSGKLVLNRFAIIRAEEKRGEIAKAVLAAHADLKSNYEQLQSYSIVEQRMTNAIDLCLREADAPAKPAEQMPAPTPQINVTVAMPEVQRMEIVSMPDRATTTTIKRDALQQIVESTQVEKDAP